MLSVKRCDLPVCSLLAAYRDNGAYADCYVTQIDKNISQAEFVEAFYTTALFKTERKILQWVVAKPSTDAEACLLACAGVEKFSAWEVEARREDQILLSDYRRRTRSWLMSEPAGSKNGDATRLYFGSAVVPIRNNKTEEMHMGKAFSFLLPFHRLYAQALLLSARSRLLRQT